MADVIEMLQQDHHEVRTLLQRLGQSTTDDERAELFRELVRELARHETAEEEVVHPTLRRLDGGEAIADARIQEEAEAERLMADMEKLDVGSPEWQSKLETLRRDVEAHARSEEAEVFPLLRSELDDETRDRLGKILDAAKGLAPTHPHPHAPDTPPGNVLLGPFAAVADRTRDAVRRAMEDVRG